jgi:subtilisin family serine protease
MKSTTPILVCVLGFLLLAAARTPAADAPDEPIITRTADGQVISRSRRPGGGVADFLPYAPDELLVRFKDNVPPAAKSAVHGRHKATPIKRFRHTRNLELVKLPQGTSVPAVMKAYRGNPDVLYAEPNYVIEHLGAPNDPSFPLQWNLQDTLPGDIKAVPAWDITTGNRNVVVAVIDSGIDYTHPDLTANMWRNEADCNNNGIDDDGNGYIDDCYGIDTFNDDSDPMDDNNHGTHVAGIIGAVGNNSLGVTGIAWNVRIMACKFMGADGFGTVADAIDCLEYVQTMKDRGVNIVATNNSWGSYGYSQALFDAVNAHLQRGILFITAAGNGWGSDDIVQAYPATLYLPNVISVAATGRGGCKSNESRWGKRTVHIGAPGENILSTTIGNTYSTYSGTSMAAAHVTGVAALIAAHDPAKDWKAIKNLILAGGDNYKCQAGGGDDLFITSKRLNAYGSLTCSNSVVFARLRPYGIDDFLKESPVRWGSARPLVISALHINCEKPNGDINVIIDPGGQVITLRDDGLGADQAAGDGIYSAEWSPTTGGLYTLSFPSGDVVTVEIDPHLKLGFPVKTLHLPGSYFVGPKIHTLVGNITGEPNPEIIVSGISSGPLYAWKYDGTLVPGWPVTDILSVAYPALGELSRDYGGYEVVAGFMPDNFPLISKINAYTGDGNTLPGWPRNSANYTDYPPSLGDIDGDGVDEIFIQEEDGGLHAYRADGTQLPGWPAWGWPQRLNTSAIADLDGDGYPELVTASESSCSGVCGSNLYAFRRDATPLSGFPVTFGGAPDNYLAIGDVDGDGSPEIIAYGSLGTYGSLSTPNGIYIFSNHGNLKRTIPIEGSADYMTAPALADLDGDGIPEIIVQTDGFLTAVRGDGSIFPGWPVPTGGWKGNSSPVVGDVDGDGLPDIVITSHTYGESVMGEVQAYNRNGTLLSGFPKKLPIGDGAVPAIADLDLNGRNDIIVTGDMWNGFAGEFEKVWVYEIDGPPHGAIQWGQFMEGPKHHGFYRGGFFVPKRYVLNVKKDGSGKGAVVSSSPAIDCGGDCAETFNSVTSVTLEATAGSDSVFIGWSGGGCSGTGSCNVSVTGDTIIKATFDLRPVTLHINKSGKGNGTVFTFQPGLNCGNDCEETYPLGTFVQVWALPEPGSVFAGWSGAGCVGTAGCWMTLTSDTTLTARFNLPTLSVGSTVLPSPEVRANYNASMEIDGGVPPYISSVTLGSLPAGLKISGLNIVGTPTRVGKSQFTVHTADDHGAWIDQQYALTTYPPVKIRTNGLKNPRVGRIYSVTLGATGGKSPYSWSILSGSLPPGLHLNPSTGEIAGVPTSSGSFNLVFQVTDPLGGQAQRTLTLTIK